MRKTISINEKLSEEVKGYCRNTGRTFSGFIRFLIKKYLKNNGKEE